MNEIYLAKISEKLIFTNGSFFSLVEDYFPGIKTFSDFLELPAKELDFSDREFKQKLPDHIEYLDLIENQHIFATGCTYQWSQEQLDSTLDNDVYKMLYLSERSMFFYKGNKQNIAKNTDPIGIRKDAKITIPEAELVAVFNNKYEIIGYTIGNDVTALDLEKNNPLYQAMAKFYKGSVALLPMIKIGADLPITKLKCQVTRNKKIIVETEYSSKNFNRRPQDILNQLKESNLNENGGFLFLGCGIPYPIEFGLTPNDLVEIVSDKFPIALKNDCRSIG